MKFLLQFTITVLCFTLLLVSSLFCHFSSYITNFNNVDPWLASFYFFGPSFGFPWLHKLCFFQTDPQLAQAILGNDLNKLQQLLRERNRHKTEMRRQQDEELVRNLKRQLISMTRVWGLCYINVQLTCSTHSLLNALGVILFCRHCYMQILLMWKLRRKSKLQFARLVSFIWSYLNSLHHLGYYLTENLRHFLSHLSPIQHPFKITYKWNIASTEKYWWELGSCNRTQSRSFWKSGMWIWRFCKHCN